MRLCLLSCAVRRVARSHSTTQKTCVARLHVFYDHGSARSSYFPWAAVCGTAAAAAAGLLAGTSCPNLLPVAHGDAEYVTPATEAQNRQQFWQWMAANGADVSAAELQASRQVRHDLCSLHACEQGYKP